MRRTILLWFLGFGLFGLLALSAGREAFAQHRGGARISMGGGFHFGPGRAAAPHPFQRAQIRPAFRRFDRDHDHDGDRDRGRFRGAGRGHYRGNLSNYGLGYGYLPYDYGYGYGGYDSGYAYPADYNSAGYSDSESPQVIVVEQPPAQVQAPAPKPAKPAHAVIENYTWPAKRSSRPSKSEARNLAQKDFGIVLKDGSVLTAETVFASNDGIHYVDPDGRHMQVAMNEVDRAATLRLNRERDLSLYLPAPE
jgi:hypothetical protein